jgi:hypothetical protein
MRDKQKLVQNGSDSAVAFSTKRKAATEYEKEQEAFRENYERLKAERLARDAAKLKEQKAIT